MSAFRRQQRHTRRPAWCALLPIAMLLLFRRPQPYTNTSTIIRDELNTCLFESVAKIGNGRRLQLLAAFQAGYGVGRHCGNASEIARPPTERRSRHPALDAVHFGPRLQLMLIWQANSIIVSLLRFWIVGC